MSKEEILKKLVIDIWKTIKLNDPPSWTEKQQQEWLVNRLSEALDTMRDETKSNSWTHADEKGIEMHAQNTQIKKVLEWVFERIKDDKILWAWLQWRIIPDKLKTKLKETKE